MAAFIAPTGSSPVRTLRAQARSLARLLAVLAIFAVAIHPSTVTAAESALDTDPAGATRVIAVAASSPTDGGNASDQGFGADDGEDRFDEGDDEFDCDNVNEGEDPCEDNPEDRVDEGDDEFQGNDADEGGCENYDDGEDRCLDDGEDRIDEGDDEFEAGCENYDDGEDRCLDDGEDRIDEGDDEFGARPEPTDARAAATSSVSAAPIDLTTPGALAAVIGLGAGGMWLARRGRN